MIGFVTIDLEEPFELPLKCEERIDGHRVLARLLRPGDPECPEDDPPPVAGQLGEGAR